MLRAVALVVVSMVALTPRDAIAKYFPDDPRTTYAGLSNPLEKLTPQMGRVLANWLMSHRAYYVVNSFHCVIAEEYSNCETRLRKGNPYTAVGDFNGDRQIDFAVLLEIEPGAGPNTLVMFNAPFGGPMKEPAFVYAGLSATDVLEVKDDDGKVALSAGPAGSNARVWPLANGSYTFEPPADALVDDDVDYILDDERDGWE